MSSLCKNPVFVLGVFRSGTSLLFSLLNQHPEIGLMYECNVWDFPRPLHPIRFRRDWLRRQEFFNQALSRHRLTFGGSLRGLEDVKSPDDLYRTYAAGRGASVWGEKSPLYARRLRDLARQYPGASFVLIWRDPAEIYRSILAAGRTSPFFRRRGMLARVVACHEAMIRDVRRLKRQGASLCEVEYDDLVENPGIICRIICGFLHLEFDPRMASLEGADFSSVFNEKHHDHLRRGVIIRQKVTDPLLNGTEKRVLHRFHNRWLELRHDRYDQAPLPSALELFRYRLTGSFFLGWDQLVRVLYEFLPLSWLCSYRRLKRIFSLGEGRPVPQVSLRQQLAAGYKTILGSYALIALIAELHIKHPHLMMLPLYLIPGGMLTRKINRRWGAVATIIAAATAPVVQALHDPSYDSIPLLFWNWLMRLFTLWIIVILFERVSGAAGETEKATA